MKTLWEDLRYGWRGLVRNPGFALTVVLTLSLGIGAISAIFGIVHAVLLRPLPLQDPDRVVMVWGWNQAEETEEAQISSADFRDWQTQARSFQHLALFRTRSFNLVAGGEPERISAAFVSKDFFQVLGVKPMMGRTFTAEEDQPGGNDVVILNDGLWRRRFGADPNIVGKSVVVQGESLQVVGVMPPAFDLTKMLWGVDIDIWTPLALEESTERDARWLWALGRLKPGVSAEQAQAEMVTVNQLLATEYPASNTGWGVRIEPIHEAVVGDVERSLLLIFGTVAFVLLIACVNVINLSLARATARRGELAVRTALGASRRRIIRLMLTESLVLAAIGAAAGVLLAFWCQRLLISLAPENIPRLDEVEFDTMFLGFVLLVTTLAALAIGLIPALRIARRDLTSPLREEGRGGDGGGHRLRSGLVVAEVALALVLLTGAGLLIRSFQQMRSVDPGFVPENVLTLTTIPRYDLKGSEAINEFLRASLERISAIPGVESASEINFLPFAGHDAGAELTIAGRPPAGPGEDLRFHFRAASPGYFRTMGIPMLRGRAFTSEDLQTPNVVIVNETAAKVFWSGGNPLGAQVRYGGSEGWLTVVGIVRDVRYTKLTDDPVPEVYVPYTADTYSTRTFVLRSELDPERLTQAVRDEVRQVNRNLPLFDIKTMEQHLDESLALERFVALLLTLLAALASILAVVGVYSLMAYSVARRTHEIGIRMALGARSFDVIRMVLLQGARLVLVGAVLGLAGAAVLTQVLQGVLFGVSSMDPVTYLSGSAILVATALLASLLAVRKASKVDPMLVLRSE